ncbi:ABC transporter ATP-binding protein/permease [Porticoccaceae bacterium]|nr:ABC transporter ATP-binding protein/permease [Porticoccaceae bacterium]
MNSLLPPLKELFLHFDKRRRRNFYLLIILMVLSSLAEVLSIGAVLPFLVVITSPDFAGNSELGQLAMGYFGYQSPQQLVLPLTITFLLATLLSAFLRIASFVWNTKIAFAAGSEISIKVFKSTLSKRYIDHKTNNSSEFVSVFATKIDDVIYRSIQPALQLVSSICLVVFIVSFLMVLDPLLIFMSVAVLSFIYVLISKLCYSLLASDSDNISIQRDNIIRSSTESLASIRDIIINKSHRIHGERYGSTDLSLRNSQAAIIILSNLPKYILEAVSIITIVSVAFFFSSSSSSIPIIGLLGTIAMAAQRLLPAFQQIYGSWATIAGNASPFSDVLSLLNFQPPSLQSPNSCKLVFEDAISLKALSFTYPQKSAKVLENISIKIPKNSCVAFVGSTGSGKSTLMDLILGLLEPGSGTIFVDDLPVDDTSAINEWHSLIAHVPQNVYLADATIKENITLCGTGDKIDEELLHDAARRSLLTDFIESLPEGFDTRVGEDGGNLSGGQRQRIGIARSLYRDSPVLVLDEATSALDNATEQSILKNILTDRTKTILMVSHRIQTVKNCDLIYELREGRIESFGPYEQLLETSESFKQLASLE